MPGAILLPSWLASPMAPFMGPRSFVAPPGWLTPWPQFGLYMLAALFSGPARHQSDRD